MELLITVIRVFAYATLGVAVFSGIIFYSEHRKDKKKRKEERAEYEIEKKINGMIYKANDYIREHSGEAYALAERSRELGVDAHKRIDANRKLMLLIETYYEERLSTLEDKVFKKGKK